MKSVELTIVVSGIPAPTGERRLVITPNPLQIRPGGEGIADVQLQEEDGSIVPLPAGALLTPSWVVHTAGLNAEKWGPSLTSIRITATEQVPVGVTAKIRLEWVNEP